MATNLMVLETTRLKDCQLDAARGEVTAQAGLTIGELLGRLVPSGWMVPVVPGTQHVSVGGAIAGNLILQWIFVRRAGGFFALSVFRNFHHPGAKQVWNLMWPILLGLALPQVCPIYQRIRYIKNKFIVVL